MAVEIVVKGSNASGGALTQAAEQVRQVGEAGGQSESKLKGFFSLMGGAALGGVVAVGGALVGAAGAGLSFNNSMEQARARINAFTKDAGATEQVLAMVAERAAKTPFAFEEMASAAAALGPVAKSSGVDLESLIEKAEILAASNPAEGLEGAAFALKEAVSGDFTSAIERFNLSRSYINELRAQGVPDLEALSMAMTQAGYDTDLVSQLANTAQGRWSTFMDTWTTLAGMVTQPIFDAVSQGLGQANDLLTQFSPQMTAAAQTVAGFIGQVIAGQSPINGLLAALQPVGDFLAANWQTIVAGAASILAFGLGGAIATAAGALAGILVAAAPVIAILAVVGAAGAALYGAWENDFGGIRTATEQAMVAIQNVIQSVLGVVQEFWANNGAQIMASTSQAWTQIQQIIGSVGAIIATIVSTVFGGIAQFIDSHGSEIQTVLSAAWNTIQNLIELALNTIQGITTTILGVLQGDWGKASEGIQQVVEGLKTFVTNQFENLKGVISALGPGFIQAAKDVGSAIIDGIASGISNGASAIAQAARDAANAALQAAKDFLGIKSPSKRFEIEVAGNSIGGWVKRLVAGRQEVAKAVADVSAAALQAARATFVQPYAEVAAGATRESAALVRGGGSGDQRTVNMGGVTINQAPGERGEDLARRAIDGIQRNLRLRRI